MTAEPGFLMTARRFFRVASRDLVMQSQYQSHAIVSEAEPGIAIA
jgi:hypothetical protein